MTQIHAFGIGIATLNNQGEWLDTLFPSPLINLSREHSAVIAKHFTNGSQAIKPDFVSELRNNLTSAGMTEQGSLLNCKINNNVELIACVLQDDQAPKDVPEAYLKLHLLSHRLARPHSICLDGTFSVLKNIAFTSQGPIDLPELEERTIAAKLNGIPLQVHSVDKFPRMTDYVVPSGIRIGDASRIRLGAYLGKGTTVMHEGFINFNAGTEGPNMIEGRISAGVFIGANSDLGASCSTMGTLSGGNNRVLSVGENCLLGANSGIGIALGDRCTIEAGLYVTAGSKVTILNNNRQPTSTVKALTLSGKNDLLFIRNSESGRLECLSNNKTVELNNELHSHN